MTTNFNTIHDQATKAAKSAALDYFNSELGGKDHIPCGFARVNVYGVKGSTKLGKQLMALGFYKAYSSKALTLHNPARMMVQNVDTLYAGAIAYAKVLRDNGIDAYPDQNLD